MTSSQPALPHVSFYLFVFLTGTAYSFCNVRPCADKPSAMFKTASLITNSFRHVNLNTEAFTRLCSFTNDCVLKRLLENANPRQESTSLEFQNNSQTHKKNLNDWWELPLYTCWLRDPDSATSSSSKSNCCSTFMFLKIEHILLWTPVQDLIILIAKHYLASVQYRL